MITLHTNKQFICYIKSEERIKICDTSWWWMICKQKRKYWLFHFIFSSFLFFSAFQVRSPVFPQLSSQPTCASYIIEGNEEKCEIFEIFCLFFSLSRSFSFSNFSQCLFLSISFCSISIHRTWTTYEREEEDVQQMSLAVAHKIRYFVNFSVLSNLCFINNHFYARQTSINSFRSRWEKICWFKKWPRTYSSKSSRMKVERHEHEHGPLVSNLDCHIWTIIIFFGYFLCFLSFVYAFVVFVSNNNDMEKEKNHNLINIWDIYGYYLIKNFQSFE